MAESKMDKHLATPSFPENAIEKASKMLGKEFRIELWNEEASKDVIRHYAWGIGDDNPLYCNEDYAKKTKWNQIIAPPLFLYSVFDAVIAPDLPDIQWIYSGADWNFFKPVFVNDTFKVKATLYDAKEVSGKLVKKMIIQTGKVTYFNQNDEKIAECLSHCFRIPRAGASDGLWYENRKAQTYTEAELKKIEKEILNEERRGNVSRYWEDVTIGEEMPAVIKGPLNRMDMTCYYAGAVGTSGYKSTEIKWKYAYLARTDPEKIPNNYDPSYYAAAISPSIGHQDESVAQKEIGMPGAYDNGPQRMAFMTHCVTNWMGDSGFVKYLSVRIKLPNIFSDTTWCRGKVTEKRIEEESYLTNADIWAENQLGQTTAIGKAVIELPSKG
jgi:acyl dehydratase